MPRYFAHVTHKGPVRYGQIPCSIGVLEAPDKPMPIGEASCKTWDANGLAVWALRVGKQQLSGRWVIVDREFTPLRPGPAAAERKKAEN